MITGIETNQIILLLILIGSVVLLFTEWIRMTLLAITRDTTNELVTSLTNRNFPSTALSSYACAEGDRVVIEIGLGGNISSGVGGTVGHNGSIRWGCSASSGDLPEDDTRPAPPIARGLKYPQTSLFCQIV